MLRRWGVTVSLLLAVAACGGSNSDAPRLAVPTSETARSGTTDEARRSSEPTTSSAAITPASTTTPTTPPPTSAAVRLPAGDDTTVQRGIDGDTIVVAGGTRVRLIGIDTPETKDPRTGVQCFGREAARRTSELLPAGTPIRLVYDVERHDRYDRTLAYVYRLSDGLFVNAALVRDGYALAYTYPPNVAHSDEFVALQREAREANRGLWGACPSAGGNAASAPAGAGETSGPIIGGGPCDPAYPGVCIPSPPPDLDCGDVGDRRFRVLPPDPHGFDRDANGVGCES